MQARQAWPEGLETNPRSLRSPSISSEVLSTSAKSTNTVVPFANPSPAYIAPTGATNLVSTELDRTVIASSQALILVNEFLDQVLFNILATSRSVTLSTLRAAVPNVLKPRLGKAAVRVAEEDLKEYLEDEEEAELNARKTTSDLRPQFDLELAWKLARLRCMVYAQLGDLEEEDEEEWLDSERLLVQAGVFQTEHSCEIELGPAAAIFLASVIEYLGQQALLYAAQHALRRHDSNKMIDASGDQQTPTLTPRTDEIILEGKDMNHVGRDSPLSRLWRSWRRNTRDAGSGLMSPDSLFSSTSPSHSRTGSQAPGIQQIAEERNDEVHKSPAQIPLPMVDNDIDQIEVPGLASAISDSEDDTPEVPERSNRRPVSMVVMPGAFPDTLLTPTDEAQPVSAFIRPFYERKRSSSMPASRKESLHAFRQDRINAHDQLDEVEQEVAVSGESTQPPVSPGLVYRRGQLTPREPGSPNKRDGMVGGGLAAAVGALGAGTAVTEAASSKDEESLEQTQSIQRIELQPPPSPKPMPKQTAAKAMLRTGSAVQPPQDATTGASITNVADFDSMYVPMAMHSGTADLANRYSIYAPPPPTANTGIARKPVPESINEVEQTTSARANAYPPESGDRSRIGIIVPPSRHEQFRRETTYLPSPPIGYAPDSPVSPEPVSASEPHVSSYVTADAWEPPSQSRPGQPPVNEVRHGHADSQTSMHSHHSKSSSSSSRLLGFTRDATGRPHTLSQQFVGAGVPDTLRAGHEPSPPTVNREGRPSTASSLNKPLPKIQDHRQNEEENEQKKKSLEVLIHSNETLHYTLTPATVMKENQPIVPARRTETQDMADFLRNTGPPNSDLTRPVKPPALTTQPLSSNPLGSRPVAMANTPQVKGVIPSSRNFPQAAPSPYRNRNPLGEARNPRTESSLAMRDLADYARSTGPLTESQLPQALSPRPFSSMVPLTNNARPAGSNQSANRLRHQARDPRPKADGNSDLIDFIREGPPRNPGEHRIDRRVAPFRTTMDSEDLNNLAPNMEDSSITYSAASTYDRSADTSINSHTALLASHNRDIDGNIGSQYPRTPAASQFESNGMPQRTRRRVKDPYAIDDSDEEDFDDKGRSNRGNDNEESLIDFLRNTAPPPSMAPQPILAAAPKRSYPEAGPPQAYNARPSSSAREESPHLTQIGSKMDRYRPTQVTHAAHVDRNRGKPRVDAREARPMRTDTADLADFLRSSGPPPGSSAEPQRFYSSSNQASPQRDNNGLFRSFTKRKAK